MKLAGDNLIANLVGVGAVGCVSQAFKCEFFGSACATTGDDVAIYNHAVGKELLAVQFYFTAGEAGALAILEESCLRENQRCGADGEDPLALCVELIEDFGDCSGSLQVLNAGAATREADCVEFSQLAACGNVAEENVCLNGETMGSYNIKTFADGSESHIEAAALPVVERGDEFGFFETICHQKKNVHWVPLFLLLK